MAGPIPSGRLHEPRRITKVGEHSNPVIRSFIASFDVAIIVRTLPLMLLCPDFFMIFFKQV